MNVDKDISMTVVIPTQTLSRLRINAYPSGVPGLVVHVRVAEDDEYGWGWTLTHIGTGRMIGSYETREEAVAGARRLSRLADWTFDTMDEYMAWPQEKIRAIAQARYEDD